MQRRITSQALAAYRAGDWLSLHRELNLRPWQPSPLDVGTDAPPGAETNAWAHSWALAVELREELERANKTS
jgi:hypothetical protein